MANQLVDALTAYTAAQAGSSPYLTAIPGLIFLRAENPRPPMPLYHKPSICLVAQGAKRSSIGETHYEYRAGQALIVGMETPMCGWVSEASVDKPFLGIIIQFDLTVMRELITTMATTAISAHKSSVFVGTIEPTVNDCALRLVRLLQTPQAIATLAPLIMRELSYWLLNAPYGNKLASMIIDSQQSHGIVAAIHHVRNHYTETLRIEELAETAQMSASTLHRQFKTVTSMSPLQYQKQMRLLQARTFMIADGFNAETAALKVGYESQSQFSREYSRMFGQPPRRDTKIRKPDD